CRPRRRPARSPCSDWTARSPARRPNPSQSPSRAEMPCPDLRRWEPSTTGACAWCSVLAEIDGEHEERAQVVALERDGRPCDVDEDAGDLGVIAEHRRELTRLEWHRLVIAPERDHLEGVREDLEESSTVGRVRLGDADGLSVGTVVDGHEAAHLGERL